MKEILYSAVYAEWGTLNKYYGQWLYVFTVEMESPTDFIDVMSFLHHTQQYTNILQPHIYPLPMT